MQILVNRYFQGYLLVRLIYVRYLQMVDMLYMLNFFLVLGSFLIILYFLKNICIDNQI